MASQSLYGIFDITHWQRHQGDYLYKPDIFEKICKSLEEN